MFALTIHYNNQGPFVATSPTWGQLLFELSTTDAGWLELVVRVGHNDDRVEYVSMSRRRLLPGMKTFAGCVSRILRAEGFTALAIEVVETTWCSDFYDVSPQDPNDDRLALQMLFRPSTPGVLHAVTVPRTAIAA